MTRIYLLLLITFVGVAASPYWRSKSTAYCCKSGDWDSCFCVDMHMAGICIDKRCLGCNGCKAKPPKQK